MDDFTQRMVERTRARQEMMQQKMQQQSGIAQPRKRRPLSTQNSEENLTMKMISGEQEFRPEVVSESPNKRTRTDCKEDENIVNQRSSSDSDVIQSRSKTKQPSHVSQRMQKLLNQRKIWEAEEQGHDVSYDSVNLPSPIVHEHSQPEPQRKTQSLEHEGRKRRLAALAARVKDWEDDISHHDPPKTPESGNSPVRWKPPTGRVQQVSAVPVEKIVPQHASTPVEDNHKAVTDSADGLSVEGLAKFALTGKASERRSPAKKSAMTFGPNAKTILQTGKQTITVNSCHGNTEKIAQNSRTLQQRMQELQNNGITEADLNAMNTSSANIIMERARAEREKELAELRNRKVHGIRIHRKSPDDDVKAVKDTTEEKTDVEMTNNDDQQEVKPMDDVEVNEESEQNDFVSTEQDEIEDSSQCEDEIYTSACDKSVKDKEEDEEEEDEDQQELSYSDSLLDEFSTAEEKDDSAVVRKDLFFACPPTEKVENIDVDGIEVENIGRKIAEVSVSEEKSESIEQEEGGTSQMIDDLFEKVLSDEEQALLTPPPRSQSPITIPSLTRQKSKLEIKSELTVRKQTCNEAEDRHVITQPNRFQRTCLSKSNSTESIVSLCQEKDFPVYTISSYRTEKRQSTRVDKRVVRNEAAAARASMIKRTAQDKRPVSEIISDMMEQVSRQQRVIQQASAALNCCYDVQHGKGTITEVEAEKLLLITSERRLALLAEIQRLKQKRAGREESSFKPCPGAVIVSNIRLPLRTEYIFSIANRRDAGELRNHYYFALVRNGPQMFATQLVSTLDDLSGDSLVFKDEFTIENLSSDFKIALEVYSLNHRTRADGIPVQDKTKGKLSGILHKSLTPKKLRSSKRTSHMPSMMSPGGPNAIRISNFSLIGSTTVNLSAITGRKFPLQKVPFLSPISGQLLCKFSSDFQSSIEQRGFLTMFDDVGGLGAWHRRWCALSGGKLFSWTYPDDEQYKKPLMTLSLRECISKDINTVERILCARPNTFELRTMRPRRQGDKQNLISEDTGSVITTKHWLSADTKEERIAWIEALNQALVDVRAWDMNALKPFK